jgi:osmotically-inducible protein OsmY
MMRFETRQMVPLGVVLMLLGAVGCQNTAEGVAEDTSKNTQVVAEGAQKAGEKVEEGVQKTGEALNEAGEKVEAGAKKAGAEIKEGAETAGAAVVTGVKKTGEAVQNVGERSEDLTRVKTAFAANAKLKASQIDVDTMADGNGVVLKGTVASAEEKTLAERVAKETLPAGKKVQNQLTVGQ